MNLSTNSYKISTSSNFHEVRLAILISNHYTYIDVEGLTDNWNILLEWLQITKYVLVLVVSDKIVESVHI